LTDSRTLDSGLQKEIPEHKNAICCCGGKSRVYLRLENCTSLILKLLGRILIPDLRLEIREAMAPADFAPEREVLK
jgi:hypothetical protein